MNTLIDLLDEAVSRFPDTVALEGDIEGLGRVRLTRTDLRDRAAFLAHQLIHSGMEPGDKVALLSPNRPEWAVGYFGILLAGGVIVPLDVNLKEAELENIVRRSASVALVTDESERGRAAGFAPRRHETKMLYPLDAHGEVKAASTDECPGVKCGPEDLALISFSSGTTGTPKGVMLSHGNIASNVEASLKSLSCGPEDVFLSILPLSHMFESTGGLLCPLLSGARVHYLLSLNPRLIADAMQREGITVCLMVPALARLIHKRIFGEANSLGGIKRSLFRTLFSVSKWAFGKGVYVGRFLFPQVRRKLSPHLRYFITGGAALNPRVARDLISLGIDVVQGYGLTETSPVTHANHPGRKNRIGTVGPPVSGVEARIEPVEGGQEGEGEILVRGPNVMQGYFENPELTAEVIREGWFHTGDIGRLDADGYLAISGRVKNVIVHESGKNVYPEEVEEELAKSDLFKEACVIGRKTQRGGEDVFAVLVLDPETSFPETEEGRHEAAAAELELLCSVLADYKRVRGFYIWPGEELPRTTTLKHKREDIKTDLRRVAGFGPADF
jgi:long-chain acyl-CoA synthetase